MIRVSGGFYGTSLPPKSMQTICWYIDSVNIVFTFLHAVFYNCHHPLGFLKGDKFLDYLSSHNRVRKKSSPWRLLVIHVFKLYRKPKPTAIISFMQCEMLIINVSCFL
jgi:hypothetical protein